LRPRERGSRPRLASSVGVEAPEQRELAERRRADDERGTRAARAGEDFRADQQARQIFGEFARRDAIEQAERARHEDGVQQLAGAFQRRCGANAEREAARLALGPRLGYQASEHGVFFQRGEHFAGHEGLKGENAAGFDARPFRMRAGQREQTVGAPARAESAEDLRLFAAHNVGRAARIDRAETGREQRAGERRRNRQRRRGDFALAGRAWDVGRLDPALPRADHAG
jgi:hypothetical protein